MRKRSKPVAPRLHWRLHLVACTCTIAVPQQIVSPQLDVYFFGMRIGTFRLRNPLLWLGKIALRLADSPSSLNRINNAIWKRQSRCSKEPSNRNLVMAMRCGAWYEIVCFSSCCTNCQITSCRGAGQSVAGTWTTRRGRGHLQNWSSTRCMAKPMATFGRNPKSYWFGGLNGISYRVVNL